MSEKAKQGSAEKAESADAGEAGAFPVQRRGGTLHLPTDSQRGKEKPEGGEK